MIYEIDLIFCAISAFFFKNFLTFALFLFLGYFIFKLFIQKLGNVSVILYLLFIVSIFAGGVVLSFIPKKENIMCSTVVNSYYLGVVASTLLIAFIISAIIDIIKILNDKKDVVKKETKIKKKKKKE